LGKDCTGAYIVSAIGVCHVRTLEKTGTPMANALSDEEAGRQILGVFMRNKTPANGILRRNNFFDVRDSDFQRGINSAVANKWITLHVRDRYRYILTDIGYAACWPAKVPAKI
jgi:hypothetical protein